MIYALEQVLSEEDIYSKRIKEMINPDILEVIKQRPSINSRDPASPREMRSIDEIYNFPNGEQERAGINSQRLD